MTSNEVILLTPIVIPFIRDFLATRSFIAGRNPADTAWTEERQDKTSDVGEETDCQDQEGWKCFWPLDDVHRRSADL